MSDPQPLLSAGQNRPDVNENVLLWNIYLALTGGTPGTPVVPTFPTGSSSVTGHTVLMGASASQSIPIGAKGWSVSVLTGTITLDGAAGLPVGFNDSDIQTLAVAKTVTTAAASSAYVRWST